MMGGLENTASLSADSLGSVGSSLAQQQFLGFQGVHRLRGAAPTRVLEAQCLFGISRATALDSSITAMA